MTTPYVATGPEDLIALAPTVLRFDPDNSVVVMTFGRPGQSFHARVDLPRKPEDQEEVADTILDAMKQNHLRVCAVLLYSDDRLVAAAQARRLNDRLSASGIRVVDVLLVTGDRYFRILQGDKQGTVFDLDAHPFTARRVLDGVIVHKSRGDLAATLMPDEAEAESVDAVREEVARWRSRNDPAADEQWLRAAVPQMLSGGAVSDAELARLLATLLDPALLDVAWAVIDMGAASAHVDLWRGVFDGHRRSWLPRPRVCSRSRRGSPVTVRWPGAAWTAVPTPLCRWRGCCRSFSRRPCHLGCGPACPRKSCRACAVRQREGWHPR